MSERVYLAVQRRGVINLPADLRRRYRLDEPGSQVELSEREDGVIELRPHVAVPASQQWFWTREWQAGEVAVDEHVARGETVVHGSADEFLSHLDELESD